MPANDLFKIARQIAVDEIGEVQFNSGCRCVPTKALDVLRYTGGHTASWFHIESSLGVRALYMRGGPAADVFGWVGVSSDGLWYATLRVGCTRAFANPRAAMEHIEERAEEIS